MNYIKLKTNEVMVVWSDNIENETMNVYPISKEFEFDFEFDITETINYSDIKKRYKYRYEMISDLKGGK